MELLSSYKKNFRYINFREIFKNVSFKILHKNRSPRYRLGVSQRFPGGLGSKIFMIIGT